MSLIYGELVLHSQRTYNGKYLNPFVVNKPFSTPWKIKKLQGFQWVEKGCIGNGGLKDDIKNANITQNNRAYSFSTYAKFSEKLLFFTPWYVHGVSTLTVWSFTTKAGSFFLYTGVISAYLNLGYTVFLISRS